MGGEAVQHQVPAPVTGSGAPSQPSTTGREGEEREPRTSQESQEPREAPEPKEPATGGETGTGTGRGSGTGIPARLSAALRTPDALNLLPLLLAAALWAWALPRIDFRNIAEFGLLDRFPLTFYASLAVLTGGFVLTLRRAGTAPLWPATYCAAMLFALKAPPAILYDNVRYAWASKHDAIISRLLDQGTVHPGTELSGGMSAYDQWPGFFSLDAALVRAFGVDAAASFINWAPVALGLLTVPVLILVYRTFSDDWRLVWTGVWIFQLANWVGQDYLSPQGFSYLLYLTVFAVVVRHFVLPGSAGPLRDRSALDPAAAAVPPPTTTRQRAIAVLILLPVIATINASHQLTPVMLCATLFALCLTRRYRNIGLLVTSGLVMLAWNLTMGRELFLETLGTLREKAGDLLANSRPGFAGDPTGPGPELVGSANILMVLSLGGLAVAAVLLRRRLARSALPLVLAAAAPLPAFAVNDYGGEMVFRVYLFGLPGSAFFAAAALVPAVGAASRAAATARRVAAVALPVTLIAMLAGFLPSYYGKEGMHYASPGETALTRRAFDRAPEGSLFLAATGAFPDAYYRYDRYERWFFTEQEVDENLRMLQDPASYLAGGIPEGKPAYVLLTPTQGEAVIGEGYLPAGGFDKLRDALKRSPLFEVVEESEYGLVLRHRPATTG
ncbi:hypothetical protein GCM10010497_48380 [Streptomyces cinereoruber]|uniref:Glycosyltransferase n=1 Tax=Streptomyces cinereoruber TaxID=67260 RepID=A0AAV4KMC0_9ACTN|nr:hypothetical protein [Streptomyces cinereoruber]QEV33078.1 hypothetical protein CP977_13640 [Streptomyces cinereoruber]GGR39458.1 hypothetical protein GCM10010497_48380 [Streptomyces cinereoruber]